MANKQNAARKAHEDTIVADAEYFTTFRFGGRGIRDRREFDTLVEAREDAGGSTDVLVYAVDGLERATLVPHTN